MITKKVLLLKGDIKMVTRTSALTTFPTLSSFFDDPYFVGFDRLLDRLSTFTPTTTNSGYPPYNVSKVGDNSFKIEVALAGFGEDDISVSVKENRLEVKAETKSSDKDNSSYIHRGIGLRNFVREWTLADTIEVRDASFKDGLLIISLENVIPEAQKARLIPLNTVDVGTAELLNE